MTPTPLQGKMTNLTSILERLDKSFVFDNDNGPGTTLMTFFVLDEKSLTIATPDHIKSFISKEFTALVEELEGKLKSEEKGLDTLNFEKAPCNPRCHDSGKKEIIDTVLSLLNQYKQ